MFEDLQDLSAHKPVSRRRKRPSWARNDQSLMKRVLGSALMRRWTIAYLYWRKNWTAKAIAEHIGSTVGAVESVIKRMTGANRQYSCC